MAKSKLERAKAMTVKKFEDLAEAVRRPDERPGRYSMLRCRLFTDDTCGFCVHYRGPDCDRCPVQMIEGYSLLDIPCVSILERVDECLVQGAVGAAEREILAILMYVHGMTEADVPKRKRKTKDRR